MSVLFFTPLLCVLAAGVSDVQGDRLSFEDTGVRQLNDAALLGRSTANTITVQFGLTDWPNLTFSAGEGAWDWRWYAGIAVDVYNPADEAVLLYMRIDNPNSDGANNCVVHNLILQPHRKVTFKGMFRPGYAGPFWGMRGVPIVGPVGTGRGMDPKNIVAFQYFLDQPKVQRTLTFSNMRLIGREDMIARECPMPFVDRYGQYRHDQWPGKVHSDDDLAAQRVAETQAIADRPRLTGRDAYGGWLDGPQYEATGWFRLERIDGRWWLITPDGHLFFSMGMNGIDYREETFVTGRDGWFEWLPRPGDASDPFAACVDRAEGAHYMAERIDGKGDTFRFYQANLMRKYGDDWEAAWETTSVMRLANWGFNTIGTSAQVAIVERDLMPYIAGIKLHEDIPVIEGGKGYWGKPRDVFSEGFLEVADVSVKEEIAPYVDSRFCIGFFVDNELAWYDVAQGALESPPDQPARVAFVDQLTVKYGADALAAVNAAWGTTAKNWDELRLPLQPNDACKVDVAAFESLYARRYFDTVRDALRRHAPQHLYFGCRFAGRPARHIEEACAAAVDVMSYNFYLDVIPLTLLDEAHAFGKPFILGEFHFGATDRGLFHPGLMPAASQANRGRRYADYVRSALRHPDCIGTHWFQYVDEPLTGRWSDGENFNIGFVSITDTPFTELVDAARQIHQDAYAIRFSD